MDPLAIILIILLILFLVGGVPVHNRYGYGGSGLVGLASIVVDISKVPHNNPGMDTFLRILRQRLAQKHTTVAQLASTVGCSRQHIYQIVHGERTPNLKLAEKIMDVLDAELTAKTKRREKTSA